jgi:hypothetical protein
LEYSSTSGGASSNEALRIQPKEEATVLLLPSHNAALV